MNANRAISKAELRINKAIAVRARHATRGDGANMAFQARKASMDSERASAMPDAASFAYQSFLDFPLTEPAGDGVPLSRPPSSRPRSRSDISVISVTSASSTLVEGDEDDVRSLRRLLTRKVSSLMEGADEEVDKAVVWLRIVKEVLIELGKRT